MLPGSQLEGLPVHQHPTRTLLPDSCQNQFQGVNVMKIIKDFEQLWKHAHCFMWCYVEVIQLSVVAEGGLARNVSTLTRTCEGIRAKRGCRSGFEAEC